MHGLGADLVKKKAKKMHNPLSAETKRPFFTLWQNVAFGQIVLVNMANSIHGQNCYLLLKPGMNHGTWCVRACENEFSNGILATTSAPWWRLVCEITWQVWNDKPQFEWGVIFKQSFVWKKGDPDLFQIENSINYGLFWDEVETWEMFLKMLLRWWWLFNLKHLYMHNPDSL